MHACAHGLLMRPATHTARTRPHAKATHHDAEGEAARLLAEDGEDDQDRHGGVEVVGHEAQQDAEHAAEGLRGVLCVRACVRGGGVLYAR